MGRAQVALGLVLGAAADTLLADPRRGHPVAGFGRLAASVEDRLWTDDTVRGGWFAAATTLPILAASLLAERLLVRHSALGTAAVAAATWAVLGGTTLTRVGQQLADHLDEPDVEAARELLPSLCGRDPSTLDAAGLARAGIESLAENTSDATVAPVLWGALAGIPGLLTYRAINTLDAMVGHRSPRYRRFGTVAARLDDAANLLPARLTAALTMLAAPTVGGSARAGLTAWRHDARLHPSPNAGQCEASAAGVLGVRLGGATVYGGRSEPRPNLGSGGAPQVADIRRAVRLSRSVQLLAVTGCAALAWCLRRGR